MLSYNTTNIFVWSSRVFYGSYEYQHVELNNLQFSILLQSLRGFLKHRLEYSELC